MRRTRHSAALCALLALALAGCIDVQRAEATDDTGGTVDEETSEPGAADATDAEPDVPADVGPDPIEDVAAEDVPPEVVEPADALPETTPDVPPDTGPDAEPDVPPEVAPDVPPDVPADVPPEVDEPEPPPAELCRPCFGDGHCGDDGLLCVLIAADKGSFCLELCDEGACRDGYQCVDGVCGPAAGICECSDEAIAEGAATACVAPNGCIGERACAVGGLGPCDAPSPVQEEPGTALDEDCDGEVDEPTCQCGDFFCDPSEPCLESWKTCTNDCGDKCTDNASCSDDFACTKDVCQSDGTCLNTVTPGYCLISGICVVDTEEHPTDPCLACNAAFPNGWSGADGEPCDDGDECTLDDFCDGDVCQGGGPMDCDDDLSCTVDTCEGGKCKHEHSGSHCIIDDDCVPDGQHKAGSDGCWACDVSEETDTWTATSDGCDDGDPCTVEDHCDAGECGGQAKDCSDDKSCTVDECDDNGNCDHPLSASWCLIEGHCQEGGAVNTQNICQFCDPNTNQYTWTVDVEKPCDDGVPCTDEDVCWPEAYCEGVTDQDGHEWNGSIDKFSELGLTEDSDEGVVGWVTANFHYDGDIDAYGWLSADLAANGKQPIPIVEFASVPEGPVLEACLLYACLDDKEPLGVNCLVDGGVPTVKDGIQGCCWTGVETGSLLKITPQCVSVLDDGVVYLLLHQIGGTYSCEDYTFGWGDGTVL